MDDTAELFETESVEATHDLGRSLAGRLGPGDCVALTGPLGAGKTALVRGIAAGLGLADERLVSSPTFVLVHEYPCRPPVFHLDLYRLAAPGEELAEMGIEEMLEMGVVLVEWADRAEYVLPARHWRIGIEITGQEKRRFHVCRPRASRDP